MGPVDIVVPPVNTLLSGRGRCIAEVEVEVLAEV
jgi:hypothetical protein